MILYKLFYFRLFQLQGISLFLESNKNKLEFECYFYLRNTRSNCVKFFVSFVGVTSKSHPALLLSRDSDRTKAIPSSFIIRPEIKWGYTFISCLRILGPLQLQPSFTTHSFIHLTAQGNLEKITQSSCCSLLVIGTTRIKL